MHLLHALPPPPPRNSGLGCENTPRSGTTLNKYFHLGKYTDSTESTDLEKRSAAAPHLPGWHYFWLSLNIVQPKLFHFLLWLGEPGFKPSRISTRSNEYRWLHRTSSSTAPISIISSSAPKPDVSVSKTSEVNDRDICDKCGLRSDIDWCHPTKHPNNYSLVFERLHGQESPPLRRYWGHFLGHLSHLQVALILSQNILSRLGQGALDNVNYF